MGFFRRWQLQETRAQATVSPLELFFDLVFVFALTRVTDLMTTDGTARGVLRAMLVLAVLWWCWVCYAWLCNVIRADEGAARVVMFLAMGTVFVIALTIPEAFSDLPGGLSGPVVFAVGYFVVRALHLVMFLAVSAGDPTLRGQVLRFVPSMAIGTVCLLIASQLSGTAQILVWCAALVGDYLGTMLGGARWRLRSAGHFAERHGGIVIIALGESITSIGVGVSAVPISWAVIVATALGLAVCALLWWAYFDVSALTVEHALGSARGRRAIRIAQHCYSYAHLPMVVGIVLAALGLKQVLAFVADGNEHRLTDPLTGWPLVALLTGVAVYLLALVYFKAYPTGTVSLPRVVTAALLPALIPVLWHAPALVTLTLLVATLAALTGYETWRYSAHRERIRHGMRQP